MDIDVSFIYRLEKIVVDPGVQGMLTASEPHGAAVAETCRTLNLLTVGPQAFIIANDKFAQRQLSDGPGSAFRVSGSRPFTWVPPAAARVSPQRQADHGHKEHVCFHTF